ncbi:nucleolar protein 9 [Pezoporus flaviventris]|uniref:nucleolar protein 9 n=1 Tax=Pezoporus flaviventris TaxID=889875 RepID=UPI002AAFC13B|nr:nucleolar protein 9 [Pezoporus flaviventris]
MAVKRSRRSELGTGGKTRLKAPVRARLDPETSGYFRRALETLHEGLSPEEFALFAPNVLHEASRSIPALALDPWGSRLLQALLPTAPLPLMGQLLPHLIQGGLQGPMGHPLGARVEAAIGHLGGAVGGELVTIARHPPSSFVLRALLRVLGGAPEAARPPGGAWPAAQEAEPKEKGAEPAANGAGPEAKGAELPPSFPPLLEQLAEAFEKHLHSLLSPPCASLCLQVALEVLHRSQSPACARLCRALIGQLAPGPGGLVAALEDPERSRVLEAAMTVLAPPLLRELFQWELRGRLRAWPITEWPITACSACWTTPPVTWWRRCSRNSGPHWPSPWPGVTTGSSRPSWVPAAGTRPSSRRRCAASSRLSAAGSQPIGAGPACASWLRSAPLRAGTRTPRGRSWR